MVKGWGEKGETAWKGEKGGRREMWREGGRERENEEERDGMAKS